MGDIASMHELGVQHDNFWNWVWIWVCDCKFCLDWRTSIGCSFYRLRGLEKSDRVSKTKREQDSMEQVTARNWAKEWTTVPLREAELGGE